ncbi:nicotinate-nucleotide--dimethylbenzimidazole phosphoribosyltransferase [Streptacidiphilus sp. EB129]|uniref:nicotinate-nucleotide--dimethylbenzimidazole phosphoribosyltransferase n=1 Tax=Streptacidiphilus sp. EB129 TaxID=3156262 RepID=UPI003513CE86
MSDTGHVPAGGLTELPLAADGAQQSPNGAHAPGGEQPARDPFGADPSSGGNDLGAHSAVAAGEPLRPPYTFLDLPDGMDDDEDELLMPGPQGSWSESATPSFGREVPLAAQPLAPQPLAAQQQMAMGQVPSQEPMQDRTVMLSQPLSQAGPSLSSEPAEPTQPVQAEPAGVPVEPSWPPLQPPMSAMAPAPEAPQPAVAAPRRPLHAGPPIPDPSLMTGQVPVRSLADRGPSSNNDSPFTVYAPSTPPHGTVTTAVAPQPQADPEYLDLSATAAAPAVLSAEAPSTEAPSAPVASVPVQMPSPESTLGGNAAQPAVEVVAAPVEATAGPVFVEPAAASVPDLVPAVEQPSEMPQSAEPLSSEQLQQPEPLTSEQPQQPSEQPPTASEPLAVAIQPEVAIPAQSTLPDAGSSRIAAFMAPHTPVFAVPVEPEQPQPLQQPEPSQPETPQPEASQPEASQPEPQLVEPQQPEPPQPVPVEQPVAQEAETTALGTGLLTDPVVTPLPPTALAPEPEAEALPVIQPSTQSDSTETPAIVTGSVPHQVQPAEPQPSDSLLSDPLLSEPQLSDPQSPASAEAQAPVEAPARTPAETPAEAVAEPLAEAAAPIAVQVTEGEPVAAETGPAEQLPAEPVESQPLEAAVPAEPGAPTAEEPTPAQTPLPAAETAASDGPAAPAAESGPEGVDSVESAEIPPMEGTAAPAYDDEMRDAVHRVMRERRDIRNGFRPDPIPHEVLIRVLEAAHTAPSVGYSQPWDFVVIRSAKTRARMHELAERQRDAYAESLPKGRAKQFKELKIEAILETPVNIVVTADRTRGGRHTLGRHTQPQMAPYSAALAVENLWLAARAEGLGVGWVSFFDEREMVTELGLPEHLDVVAYLCVGYVNEFPAEPELAQAGWAKKRPLSWVVHEETYGRRALPGEEPHSVLQETLRGIRPLDAKALGEAWDRQKRMTKPAGSLGMLEIISAQLCGLSRKCPPPVPEPACVAVFAGDHGVHAQGVTHWPQEVTAQMVANFLAGGAVVNAFATQLGAEVCVVDVGVASELPPAVDSGRTTGLLPRKVRAGTADMTQGPAMTREEALRAVEVGIETARDLVAAGNKALITGDMGIANTTAAAALICVFTGEDPSVVTGRGTGIDDETHARKIAVIRQALDLHRPDTTDPIGVLAAVGGLEHAAIAGFLLGAASLRTPVILDGVIAGAAALVAKAIAPEVLAACIAGHRSAEPGHKAALAKLGLRPLIDLDLRLGEGTGALLALPLVQSAARAMHDVATFDSAGVTEKH